MGWNDHINDPKEEEMVCPHCGKKFTFERYPQTLGFKDRCELRCPHCLTVIDSSMEWEFFSYEIENK